MTEPGPIQHAQELLQAAQTTLVLTGAGVVNAESVSGVPTFRGPDGLWLNNAAGAARAQSRWQTKWSDIPGALCRTYQAE